MDTQRLAVLAHLFAVLAFVSGYVATNVMTEVARRAETLEDRRMALKVAGRFDRLLNARGEQRSSSPARSCCWRSVLDHDAVDRCLDRPVPARSRARGHVLGATCAPHRCSDCSGR